MSNSKEIVPKNPKVSLEPEGRISRVLNFKDKHQIVRLEDEQSFKRESELVDYNLGPYDSTCELYSLRDNKNCPLVNIKVKDKEIIEVRQFDNNPLSSTYVPFIKKLVDEHNLSIYTKVTYSKHPLAQAIDPMVLTFLAFKWQLIVQWIIGNNSGDQLPALEMLNNPTFLGAIKISLLIAAGFKWLDFFVNFNLSGTTEKPLLSFEEVKEIPELEEVKVIHNTKY